MLKNIVDQLCTVCTIRKQFGIQNTKRCHSRDICWWNTKVL